MKNDNLKLENQLCHRFYVAANAITRAYRPLLEALDITYPQYVVLMALWEKDNVPVNNVTSRTKIDGGSLTQILNKLMSKKIIKIEHSEQDKRMKSIVLTRKGKNLKEKSLEIPSAMSCKITSLSSSEIKSLMNLLDKVNSDLETN